MNGQPLVVRRFIARTPLYSLPRYLPYTSGQAGGKHKQGEGSTRNELRYYKLKWVTPKIQKKKMKQIGMAIYIPPPHDLLIWQGTDR